MTIQKTNFLHLEVSGQLQHGDIMEKDILPLYQNIQEKEKKFLFLIS